MSIKLRLILQNFLQFAIWGAYLISMGTYLAGVGLGSSIGWFYSVQGIVCLFMPALVGIIADRWIEGQRLLSLCHALSGGFMLAVSAYAYQAGATPSFSILFSLYTLSLMFFMPTIALSYSVAYSSLSTAGLDAVKAFPPIRVWGTIGFVLTMWLVDLCSFQHTPGQWLVSGCLGILMSIYALTLPRVRIEQRIPKRKSLSEVMGLNALRLLLDKRMATFMLFSILLGFCLQISNGYANPYITSFSQVTSYQSTFGVQHANILLSVSQISETLCILFIPFFFSRLGIKRMVLIALLAWTLRFAFLGLGNPGSGVGFLLLSMLLYGVAFDFFNISGSLFVNQATAPDLRSSAQGLFMMMTNGLGSFIGMLVAQAVVNYYVYTPQSAGASGETIICGWQTAWYIFAAYALVVAVLFTFFFNDKSKTKP